MRPTAIITDLEGTISSSRFYQDILLIYAEQFLPDYVRENKDERDVARQLRSVSDKTGIGLKDTEGLIGQMQQWMRDDRGVTELNVLQSMVWEQGFQQGDFRTHVYEDVPDKLREWLEREINLYVHASIPEKAQRLLLRYSRFGDLRLLFAGYFDSTREQKQEAQTYRKLEEAVALKGQDMLFISDTEAELGAAREAGFHTLRVAREEECDEDPDEVESAHPVVSDFGAIDLDRL